LGTGLFVDEKPRSHLLLYAVWRIGKGSRPRSRIHHCRGATGAGTRQARWRVKEARGQRPFPFPRRGPRNVPGLAAVWYIKRFFEGYVATGPGMAGPAWLGPGTKPKLREFRIASKWQVAADSGHAGRGHENAGRDRMGGDQRPIVVAPDAGATKQGVKVEAARQYGKWSGAACASIHTQARRFRQRRRCSVRGARCLSPPINPRETFHWPLVSAGTTGKACGRDRSVFLRSPVRIMATRGKHQRGGQLHRAGATLAGATTAIKDGQGFNNRREGLADGGPGGLPGDRAS